MGTFGAVDIGQGAYWWDYGQLKLYYFNNFRVTQVNEDVWRSPPTVVGVLLTSHVM